MRGRDKLLEMVDGAPLLRTLALRALATGLPVWVVLPPEGAARLAALEGLRIMPVIAENAARGMAESLKAGLAALPGADRVMILLSDMPDILTEDMKYILQCADENPGNLIWSAADEDGRQGHPILFSRALFTQLMTLEGDNGARSVVKAVGDRLHLVPLPGGRARRDLDTPEEWKAWHAEQRKKRD